jgi:hypothetical protein
MWWDDDSWVARRVPGLLERWHDGELPFVNAIGSTWVSQEERTLLLGVEARRDPRPRAWAPEPGGLDRLARALIRAFGPLPTPYRLAARSSLGRLLAVVTALIVSRRRPQVVLVPLTEADPATRSQLERFDLPDVTRIVYLGEFRPLSRRAMRLFSHGSRATAGCLLLSDGRTAVTTAGHLGAGLGDRVYRRLTFRFARSPLGRVATVTHPGAPDPVSPHAAGVDVATVETTELALGDWTEVNGLADAPGLQFDDVVVWSGGVTGRHTGTIVGTAAEMNKPDRPYMHSLLVSGIGPRGGGRRGDSGAAVFTWLGDLVGHLVGTHGAYSHGAYPMVWVQVIDVQRRYIEDRTGPIGGYYRESAVS